MLHDEGMRPGTNLEQLSKLKPSFRNDGRITAGLASQISDGASAVLLASDSVNFKM
jgi:acetyl-CoA acetyltransferase